VIKRNPRSTRKRRNISVKDLHQLDQQEERGEIPRGNSNRERGLLLSQFLVISTFQVQFIYVDNKLYILISNLVHRGHKICIED
jgi:hypothetical protein